MLAGIYGCHYVNVIQHAALCSHKTLEVYVAFTIIFREGAHQHLVEVERDGSSAFPYHKDVLKGPLTLSVHRTGRGFCVKTTVP